MARIIQFYVEKATAIFLIVHNTNIVTYLYLKNKFSIDSESCRAPLVIEMPCVSILGKSNFFMLTMNIGSAPFFITIFLFHTFLSFAYLNSISFNWWYVLFVRKTFFMIRKYYRTLFYAHFGVATTNEHRSYEMDIPWFFFWILSFRQSFFPLKRKKSVLI